MQQRRRQRGRRTRPRRRAPVVSGDEPGDERRLRVIAESRMQRPQPILRLVGIEIGVAAARARRSRAHGDGENRPQRRPPGLFFDPRRLRGALSPRTAMAAEPSGRRRRPPPGPFARRSLRGAIRRRAMSRPMPRWCLSDGIGLAMGGGFVVMAMGNFRIETFSNNSGGNAFFKAVTHPLAARAMPAPAAPPQARAGARSTIPRAAPTACPTSTISPSSISPAASSRT